MKFIHSGDLGDLIYSLPTIRALGGGDLILNYDTKRTMHGIDEKRFKAIASLLEVQDYIFSVTYEPKNREDCLLNDFRKHVRSGKTLLEMHLKMYGIQNTQDARRKWLKTGVGIDLSFKFLTIFSRSQRYHNPNFPWHRIVNEFPKASFMGLQEEYNAFTTEFDFKGPFIKTETLLEAAIILNSCDKFVGNQSCLLSIAEGLKVPIVCEVYPQAANCNFWRFDRINAYDNIFEIGNHDY